MLRPWALSPATFRKAADNTGRPMRIACNLVICMTYIKSIPSETPAALGRRAVRQADRSELTGRRKAPNITPSARLRALASAPRARTNNTTMLSI